MQISHILTALKYNLVLGSKKILQAVLLSLLSPAIAQRNAWVSRSTLIPYIP
jgi:hypothetical protein